MNRIVREHYPVSRLPEDLREGFGPDDEVRVTIDVTRGVSQPESTSKPGFLERHRHLRRVDFFSFTEVDNHVASVRDEWSDRER